MKRTFTILIFITLTFQSCMISPRFKKVYKTPDFTGYLYDNEKNPVSNAIINWQNHLDIIDTTDTNGKFYLSPKRKFQAFSVVTMDPASKLQMNIFIEERDTTFQIFIPYKCHSCNDVVLLSDTIILKIQ